MSLLIDGYNLLNATGIVGRGAGASSLERSRRALLNFLADSLEPDERAHTTVVFDAAHVPRGLPRVVEHRGLCVRFAAGYAEADALIEELIRADTAPRRLTVVSSDHRLQRAARHRRAKAVDSDVWFAQVVRRRLDAGQPAETIPAKPHAPLSKGEVAAWIERFGGEAALEGIAETAEADFDREAPEPTGTQTSEKPTDREAADLANPFPPGYGEDLLEDEPDDDPSPSQ
jgi:predicted RNA-binding protein with PIN domain